VVEEDVVVLAEVVLQEVVVVEEVEEVLLAEVVDVVVQFSVAEVVQLEAALVVVEVVDKLMRPKFVPNLYKAIKNVMWTNLVFVWCILSYTTIISIYT
jgi:hypothetical protein